MAAAKKRPLITIVEDDAGLRAAIKGLLSAAGFLVQDFASAELFLRSRTLRRAACLVLDVQLPGMSGLDLLAQLRKRGVTIPTIVVSGHADADGWMRAKTAQAGAVAFLHKPVDEKELIRTVRAASHKRIGR
jgi:FixJ family two-component response regulator